MKAGLIALALALVGALATQPAAAATKYGSNCLASVAYHPLVVQFKRGAYSSSTSKTTAPGVVTSWLVGTGGNVDNVSERLKVLQSLGGAEWEVVGESAVGTVHKNQMNEFAARIPVAAGVDFAAAGSPATPICTGSGDDYWPFTADIALGGRGKNDYYAPGIVALQVTVEPDADGDGFGDETQDRCPLSTGPQNGCPEPAVPGTGGGSGGATGGGSGSGGGAAGGFGLLLKPQLEGNTVAVRVTSAVPAPIAVTGSIRGRQIGSTTVTVQPPKPGRAYLDLPQSLKQQLAKLPRKQHLNLVLEATGRSADGATGEAEAELALPGRKKAHRHHRKAA